MAILHILVLCIFCFPLAARPLQVQVAAEAALLMNADTGAILYEKNAHDLYYPASITKIATAAYVLSGTNAALNEKITADQDAVGSVTEDAKRRSNYTLPSYWLVPGASHMGIKKGEVLTLKDLLYGMMLVSGDDASNVIAQHIGGTIPDFMDQLNMYITSLGCKKTFFNNPHGLYHPKHQTTAFDMAILTRHALQNPIFCEIVATTRYTRPKTNKQEPTILLQTNRLLREGKLYYPKAIGVKTGYIAAAQNTFVGAAKWKGRTLVLVFLKSKDRQEMFLEAIKLFEMAFNEEKIVDEILPQGPQEIYLHLAGAKKGLPIYTEKAVALEYFPAEEPLYKTVVIWDEVSLPIAKGQRLGELRVENTEGEVLQSVTLYAQHDLQNSWWNWLTSWFS